MILFKGYNDYELLYLIGENNEDALKIMMEKYQYFIYKKIAEFRVNELYKEDFLQEGLILLHNAIRKYDVHFNKTFLRFFEMLINRRFYYLISKVIKNKKIIEEVIYEVKETTNDLLEDIVVDYEAKANSILFKSKMEMQIYQEYFIDRHAVSFIESKYGYNRKQIYNTIYRLKEKLQQNK